MFTVRDCGKTLINKSAGQKIATEDLKGRVLEVNLGDLNNNPELGYRKIRLEIQEVQGRNALCDFHGMELTRDKLCSLIRKWQSLIEAFVDVKTIDGYFLRIFCIGFTKRQPDQVKSNCYAGSNQIKKIRARMVEVMMAEAGKLSMRDLVKQFIVESLGKEIETRCRPIFPLKDVYIRKVKILRKPKFDSESSFSVF